MAKRLFDDRVISSTKLLDLGPDCFNLYILLAFHADDDGVVQSSKYLLRLLNLNHSHLESLVDAGFLIVLDPSENVVVIRHWLVNNRADSRYYTTPAPEEYRNKLKIKRDHTYSLEEGISIDEFRGNPRKQDNSGKDVDTDKGVVAQIKGSSGITSRGAKVYGYQRSIPISQHLKEELIDQYGDYTDSIVSYISRYYEEEGDYKALDSDGILKVAEMIGSAIECDQRWPSNDEIAATLYSNKLGDELEVYRA